jgi:tetratricopeptide (TPR) repeat protein
MTSRRRGGFVVDQKQGPQDDFRAHMALALGVALAACAAFVMSVALSIPNAAADDTAVNALRELRAGAGLPGQPVDDPATLAERALAVCAPAEPACAQARARALAELADIETRRSQVALGLALARRAIDETEPAFGLDHGQTAIAWETWARAARDSGDLEGAGDAMARATRIAAHAVLPVRDRREIRLWQAVLDLDLGRFEPARAQFDALASDADTDGDRALVQRLLANALLETGDVDGAEDAAERAVAAEGMHPQGPGLAFALEARARAQSLAGRHEAALQEIQQARAALSAAGFAADTVEPLRARRLEAEMLARASRSREADLALAALADDLRAGGVPLAAEFARVLDDRGCLLAQAGRYALAAALHEQARAAYLRQLPPTHPWLARNALYQARAAWGAAPSAASRAALRAAARDYAARFRPPSAWIVLTAGMAALPPGLTPEGERGRLLLL